MTSIHKRLIALSAISWVLICSTISNYTQTTSGTFTWVLLGVFFTLGIGLKKKYLLRVNGIILTCIGIGMLWGSTFPVISAIIDTPDQLILNVSLVPSVIIMTILPLCSLGFGWLSLFSSKTKSDYSSVSIQDDRLEKAFKVYWITCLILGIGVSLLDVLK